MASNPIHGVHYVRLSNVGDFTYWESKDMPILKTDYSDCFLNQAAQTNIAQQQYGYMYGLMPNYNYAAVQYPQFPGYLGVKPALSDKALTDALVANEKLRKENEDMMQHIIKLQEMLEGATHQQCKERDGSVSGHALPVDAYAALGDKLGVDAPVEDAPKPRRVASPAFGQHAQLGFGDPWRKC